MKQKAALFAICGVLLLAVTGCQQKIEQHEGSLPDTSTSEEVQVVESYVAQNEKYGLSLPEADTFGQELKDFIYWEYATMIQKGVHGLMSVLTNLEEEDCLGKELKLHLYYYECDVLEMDEGNCNYYDVVLTFPEEQQMSYYSFSYNAKGFSSEYDYGYDGWFSEVIENDISSQKLEKKKWFQKQYTFFGEISLNLSRKEAEGYGVTDRFEVGKKEQILSAVKKEIKKEYKKSKNTVVYVRDFLPGDFYISGEVVDLHMVRKNSLPLFWIQSLICYSDEKMEMFEAVDWHTRYSTRYSGAGQPDYDPTVKQLKKWAKEEKEAVNIEKCILAYEIKNGKMIDLKAEGLSV